MPQIGDLFAKLALGQQLTTGEIDELRLQMNTQQLATSRLSGLLDSKGDLNAEALSGFFSVLPHQTAAMFRGENQVIPTGTATLVTYEDDSALDADELRLSWAQGIKRSPATGEFFLTGVPEKTIWLFSYLVKWSQPPTSATFVEIIEKDTATGLAISQEDAGSTYIQTTGSFQMRARKASTSWIMKVEHGNGAPANLSSAIFQVARLR